MQTRTLYHLRDTQQALFSYIWLATQTLTRMVSKFFQKKVFVPLVVCCIVSLWLLKDYINYELRDSQNFVSVNRKTRDYLEESLRSLQHANDLGKKFTTVKDRRLWQIENLKIHLKEDMRRCSLAIGMPIQES